MSHIRGGIAVGFAVMFSLVLGVAAHLAGSAMRTATAATTSAVATTTSAAGTGSIMTPTLRIYGHPNVQAGAPLTTAGVTVHPYMGVDGLNSLNNPEGPQAPRADLVTWNPAWMWQGQTVDENQQAGLYDIEANGNDGAQQVWFRHWYDPAYPTVGVHLRFTPTQSLSDGTPLTAYPALVQEFTYLLHDVPEEGRLADAGSSPFAVQVPLPIYAQAGNNSLVFPVSVEPEQYEDVQGQGITSFDADFDGRPDRVTIHSEESLSRGKPPVALDFDGSGSITTTMNPDGFLLSGDEMVIITLETAYVARGHRVQFLDHRVQVERVTDNGVTLRIDYAGGRTLVPLSQEYIELQGVWTSPSPHGQGIGPFFVQLVGIDKAEEKVKLRVGRALGHTATHLAATDPRSSFERFYVDGHEYQVVAIGTGITTTAADPTAVVTAMTDPANTFFAITLRTALPVIDRAIGVHTMDDHAEDDVQNPGADTEIALPVDSLVVETDQVDLQNYLPEMQLAVMPPFNQEHFILTNVKQEVSGAPAIGESAGPVAPIVSGTYTGTYTTTTRLISMTALLTDAPVDPVTAQYSVTRLYQNQREMQYYYRARANSASHQGEMRQIYANAVQTQTGVADTDLTAAGLMTAATWATYRWETRPADYLELVLPDLQGVDADYLVSSAWALSATADTAASWQLAAMAPTRLHFVFDPATSHALYQTPNWLRLYSEPGVGAGDWTVTTDTVTVDLQPLAGSEQATAVAGVEIPPYTDPVAPFAVTADQAPRSDFITFNPVRMSQFSACPEDPLAATLYARLGRQEARISQAVTARMWYEPAYLDQRIGVDQGAVQTQIYAALLQEFTYILLTPTGEPRAVEPGWGPIAFPIATTWAELEDPRGYGLTTFDVDFESNGGTSLHNNLVQVYSERSMSETTGIAVDFDGDGTPDLLDGNENITGDELLVLVVENINLSLDPPDAQSPYGHHRAMFLDYMVELRGIVDGGAELQLYSTGGDLALGADGSYAIKPRPIGTPKTLAPGELGLAPARGTELYVMRPGDEHQDDPDAPSGGWFVWVRDVNLTTNVATVTLGRALGATTSTINDTLGGEDFTAGNPRYLKRFYVDGHLYDVVAIGTLPCGEAECDETRGLSYITLRTPLPFSEQGKNQDGEALQGYGWELDVDHPRLRNLSMLPPFNLPHRSMVNNLVSAGASVPAHVGEVTCRPPLLLQYREMGQELMFEGELRGMLVNVQEATNQPTKLGWRSLRMEERRKAFACLAMATGEPYHVTSAWGTRDRARVQFVYEAGVASDPYINGGLPTTCTGMVFPEVPDEPDPCFTLHIVKAGENLQGIAKQYGVSIQALKELNGWGDHVQLYKRLEVKIPCRE